VSGQRLFLAFPDVPSADWLQFVGPDTNVFLPAVDFDATYRVLREESPVFVTALNVVGLRAFRLDSGDEAPGQGLADPEALVQLMARARASAATGTSGLRRPPAAPELHRGPAAVMRTSSGTDQPGHVPGRDVQGAVRQRPPPPVPLAQSLGPQDGGHAMSC
jgi:hypothetical protein